MTSDGKPLCIDLFCGLGGWAEGFLAEGWRVIGFDNERHDYGTGGYPGQLVLQDVMTLHGSQFRNADCIVASPPCQAYSYRAMPWKRAKALPPPSNELFEACFRIQRQASEAAGRDILLVVENVRGAQKWVGRARWHFGSFYLWGDVPLLMPSTNQVKQPGRNFHFLEKYGIPSPSFHGAAHEPSVVAARRLSGQKLPEGHDTFKANGKPCNKLTDPRYGSGVKQHGSGPEWFDTGIAKHSSRSDSRKAASAQIAKIPFSLARWIAQVYKPA
jgi:C-5 cytosine-specific DNA methylase